MKLPNETITVKSTVQKKKEVKKDVEADEIGE